MKDIKLHRAWEIAYPVGLYYVLSDVVFYLITRVIPYSEESYGAVKVLTTLIIFPFLYRVYRGDQIQRGEEQKSIETVFLDMKSKLVLLIAIIVMAACASIVLNNLIAWTPLISRSASYRRVSNVFFSGRVLFEILGPCIFVPILEEYVFRGLVYKRLREWLNIPWAVGISAVIFGMMHMNIVQFLYAGILGIFMALCVERTGHLYGAILAHMAANTMSVIRVETKWLDWVQISWNVEICITLGLFFVFLGCGFLFFGKQFRHN